MGIAKALAAKNGYELDSNQEVCFVRTRNCDVRTTQPCSIDLCVENFQNLLVIIKNHNISLTFL